MKNLIVTFLFIISSIAVFAQKKVDVVHLSDGSIYKGTILENNSETIKLETFCENILVFTTDEILETTTEPYVDLRGIKTSGYINFTSAGALIGSTANELRAPFSMLMEHNYRVNQYVSFGAVIGVEMLNEATVPVGFNLKGMLPLEGGSTFFIGGTVGYSFSVEDAKDPIYEITDSYGGSMANIEAGLIFPSYGHLSFFMAVGYRYNELSYKREDWWLEEVNRKIYYNRISIRVGVMFY